MKGFIAGGILGFSCALLLLPAAKAELFSSCGDTQLFRTALTRIGANYIHEVKDFDLMESAINGMATSLDPGSRYISAVDLAALQGMSGKTEGGATGIEAAAAFGLLKVIAPLDGSPAALGGVQPGDYIWAINGHSTKDYSFDRAIKMLQGTVGSKVTLTVSREGKREPFDVTLTRAAIVSPEVSSRRIADVGYIRIPSFNENTNSLVKTAIDKLDDEIGPALKGYVLDLRSDSGGFLDQAVAVSGDFLNSGEIVTLRGRTNVNNKDYKATSSDRTDGKRLVVLIDRGSAAASEIVAGALQDNHRATIIGMKSYGNGMIQTIIPLTDVQGGAVRLTTAQFFRPSGQAIQSVGITPDIAVAQKPEAQEVGATVPENSVPGSAHPNAATPIVYPGADEKSGDFQLSFAVAQLNK